MATDPILEELENLNVSKGSKRSVAPLKDDDVWEVVEKFFENNGIMRPQLDSYNYFVDELIFQVIEENPTIDVAGGVMKGGYTIEFSNLEIIEGASFNELEENETFYPTPIECMHRGITYAANVYITITVFYPDLTTPATKAKGGVHERKKYKRVHIGAIPVMVKSELCNLTRRGIAYDEKKLCEAKENIFDRGGYFIINGQKKIVITQERSAFNYVYIYHNRKAAPKYELYAEIRSQSQKGMHSTTTFVGMMPKKNYITVLLPYMDKTPIPLAILFRALGVKTEKEMASYIIPGEYKSDPKALEILTKSFEQSYECTTEADALTYIGSKRVKPTAKNDATAEEPLEDEMDVSPETVAFAEQLKEEQNESSVQYAKYILATEFLPHLGPDLTKKALYLGFMVYELICSKLGRRSLEDRDHLRNKRVAPVGPLLAGQFYSAFKRMCKEIGDVAKKAHERGSYFDPRTAIKHKSLESSMFSCISINKWGKNTSSKMSGVSQKYEEFNYAASLANSRKFSTPLSKDGGGKVIAPRTLHGTHWGLACPSETPEGKSCGLSKNMSLLCTITIGCSQRELPVLLEIIQRSHMCPVLEIPKHTDPERGNPALLWYKILLNGDWIGSTDRPEEVVRELRYLRRRGVINVDAGISKVDSLRQIRINAEMGRLCRPLLIVEKGKILLPHSLTQELYASRASVKKVKTEDVKEKGDRKPRSSEKAKKEESVEEYTWSRLLRSGYIELLDKDEEENAYIVNFPSDLEKMEDHDRAKVTHCEIHPSLVYGIGGTLIPYPNHNQSPRNTYQSSMGKQAAGIPYSNFMYQFNEEFHTLNYIQRPLVLSRGAQIIGYNESPSGINAVVSICPMFGKNQEDAIVINKSSLDLGFMRSTAWLNYYADAKKANDEQFGIPDEKLCNNFSGNTSKLDEDGVITAGQIVEKGDVLIGRFKKTTESPLHRKPYTDTSITYKETWKGVVYKVQVGVNAGSSTYYRVLVAQTRVPTISDKLCLSSDHDVLTEEGWKPIPKVGYEDKIACLDPKTKQFFYAHPTKVYEYNYEDIMCRVKSRSIDFLVTPNHRQFVRIEEPAEKEFGFVEAERLSDMRVTYRKNGHNPYPNKLIIFDLEATAFLRVVGAMYFTQMEKEKNVGARFLFSSKVRGILMDCDATLSLGLVDQNEEMLVTNRWVSLILSRLPIGRFPGWVWTLGTKNCRDLLGAICNPSEPFCVGENLLFANEVYRLAIHCGWSASLDKNREDGRDSFVVTIHTEYDKVTLENNCTRVYYCGKIHCVEVPTSIFMVRRKGKCAWTGNSSRHGQKGVIGEIVPKEDLHFNREGIVPDLVINPLALPSRMTIAKLLEMLVGKQISVTGPANVTMGTLSQYYTTLRNGSSPNYSYGEGTAFQNIDVSKIANELKKAGYDGLGDEYMTDGISGEPLKCLIFTGVVYYQRLKHMAIDKEHARPRGERTLLTRQPKEGRKRNGGFRVGVMERDNMVGQGAAAFVRDRLFEQSDLYSVYVCMICGLLATVVKIDETHIKKECRLCDTNKVACVKLPYATKVLFQDLMSMNIVPRILVDPDSDDVRLEPARDEEVQKLKSYKQMK